MGGMEPGAETPIQETTVDLRELLAALGVAGVTAIAPVTGGWDTTLWRVERGGEVFALRLLRAGQKERCRREVAAMEAAAGAGVPVPRVHAEGIWRERPVLLLSWCPGEPVARLLHRQPWQVWRLGTAFGETLARLHTVPAPEPLRERTDGWITWAGPGEEALQERLRALAGGAAALLHLDYHPLNVLTDARRITGVLDWANALAGDPRADLARTLVILRLAALLSKERTWRSQGTPRPRLALLHLLQASFLRGYRRTGRCAGPIAPFLAWAWAATARDLEPRLNRPDHWLRGHHLELMRRQAAAWKRRAAR